MSLEINGWARVVADPVLKNVGNTQVAELTVVENEYIGKDNDGNKKEITSFFDLVAWDTAAEYVANNVKKGDMLSFRGTPRQDRWEDADGNKRSKIFIRVTKFYNSPKQVKE